MKVEKQMSSELSHEEHFGGGMLGLLFIIAVLLGIADAAGIVEWGVAHFFWDKLTSFFGSVVRFVGDLVRYGFSNEW